jgi:integrase
LERLQEGEHSPWLFISERKSPLTDHSIRKIVTRAGELAGFNFPVPPHMLRHSCGYYLGRVFKLQPQQNKGDRDRIFTRIYEFEKTP